MRQEALQRALFNCHLWASARLLPFVVGRQDMAAVRRYTEAPARMPYAGLPDTYIAGRVRRAVRRPWLMRDRRCLREGLLAFRFLSLAGYRPELRFGIEPGSVKAPLLKAHCWVCLGDRPVVSDSAPGMVEILRLPQADRLKPVPA